MRAKEFKQEFDFLLGRSGAENDEVVVAIQGIGGPCENVTGISSGFDWYDGRILLHTETLLSRTDSRKYSRLQKKYLDRISNYKKIRAGDTLCAKYRTRVFNAKNRLEAVIWLTEQLDKELEC